MPSSEPRNDLRNDPKGDQSDAIEKPMLSPEERMGRRIGLGVYWVLTISFITAGAGSVAYELFFSPHPRVTDERPIR